MGKAKKPKAEEVDDDAPPTVVDGVEGFWQEFGPSLEHLRLTKAIMVVTLNRVTGEVEVDQALSTPAETWYALDVAMREHARALHAIDDDD